jgi:hypothetical protein
MSNDAGLVINNQGILDNIQVTKLGQIEWQNVKGYRMARMFFSDLILLDLFDNNVLLQNLSRRKKNMALNNIKKYGTPSVINLSNLKYDKDELLKIISKHIKQ